MFLTALWSGSNALEIAGIGLPVKLFWTNVQCISYTCAPVLWLIMVFQFIERDQWVVRRNILLGQKFGLGIMEERAKEAGGHLIIETKPGQGTRVEIEIPLSEEKDT